MPAIENSKELVRESTAKFWNAHDMAAFDRYHAAGFVNHASDGDKSCEQYKAQAQAFFAAFPDLTVTVDDMVAEGDKVTKVWTARSTHKGAFMGIPPTGKRIVVKGIYVYRVAGGKFVENWSVMDTLGMMQQLGAIPSMQPAGAAR